MSLIDTIDMTFSDVAKTVDHNAELWAERTPAPVDSVIRRFGAINAEAIRQTGLVTITTVDAIRGVTTVAWTGVSEVAEAAEEAAEESAETLRKTGRDVTGDLRRAVTTIRNRAGKAVDEVERNFAVVGRTADKVAGRIGNRAKNETDDVVKADDTAVAEVASAGSSNPSGPYENWTKDELYDRATELDIDGRSTMNKGELIRALRSA